MRLIRIIGMLLGSVWFLVASCTGGTFIVAPIVVPEFNTREVEKGEQVGSWFSVVAEPGENGLPFRVIKKYELESLISHNKEDNEQIHLEYDSIPISFLMSEPIGRIENEYVIFSYRVIEDFGEEQKIELVKEFKKVIIKSRSIYKAQLTSISPLSSRVFNYRSCILIGFPIAFGGSLMLFLIGRLLLFITRSKSVTKMNP